MILIKTELGYRWLASLVLIASFLAGCSSERAPAPPPPPTPQPFQPQLVIVELGTHGGKTTLVSTQADGWTRNGDDIASGVVVKGENGADYRLSLENGQWTAEFLPPAPLSVSLGASGDAVPIQTLEDGSFQLDGIPLTVGDVRQAENGNRYRFVLGTSGQWTAEFVPPAPVVVTLGGSGVAVRVHVLENDRYELAGRPLASGDVRTASTGEMYRFELAPDGRWTASFVAPPPISVTLGTSGESMSVEVLEGGRYQLAGQPLATGQVHTAANGNMYRLTLRSAGEWIATFVPPAPEIVSLGSSGTSVTVGKLENGMYELNGQPLESGRVFPAGNGNRYQLNLQSDGTWTAEFVPPDPVVVALGTSGETARIEFLENRAYSLDGEPLTSGQVKTAANGNLYRFSLGLSDTWTATFVPTPFEVQLGGHGGTVTLIRLENGSYRLGSVAFRSGDIVTGANHHQYRLTLGQGGWWAEPLPSIFSISLPGGAGSIALSQSEDGSYFYGGQEVRSGDRVTVNGVRYELTLTGTQGTAVRLRGTTTGPPIEPEPAPEFDTLSTYEGIRPRLKSADGTGSRAGSILEINGEEYSLNYLFSDGFVNNERTFADSARSRIEQLLSTIETLVEIPGNSFDSEIEKLWDRVADELETLFPGQRGRLLDLNAPKTRGGRDIDGDEVVDRINEVLEALSSLAAFEDAVYVGIFSDARINDLDIEEAFDSLKSVERLGFGWTENTRFGAYSKRERSRVSRELSFASGDAGIGAFAYSPLGRARTLDLPSRGEAEYHGATVAASGRSDQGIYWGSIELRVNFSRRQVTGLVSDLENHVGAPWRHLGSEVESLRLPEATLHSTDGSFRSSTSARGSVVYTPILIRSGSQTVTGDFEGQFVGTGRNAGDSAIGTWEIRQSRGILLTGAFGAEYESRIEPELPPARTDDGEISETSLIGQPDRRGNIVLPALDFDGDRIMVPASELFANASSVESGERLFEVAGNFIERQLEILNTYVDVGITGTTIRQAVWDAANQALEDNIFGSRSRNALGSSYPSGSSSRVRDSKAVQLLEDALEALGSPDRFEDSLGEDGVFDGILGTESDLYQYDFDDIYDALGYEVEIQFGHTRFGRFGAWAKTARDYAVSTTRQSLPHSESPDVFAYSPIEQTIYSAGNPNFPRNFRGTYRGRTLAVDRTSVEPLFYDGDLTFTVDWGSSASGSSVYAVIRDLASLSDGHLFVHNHYAVEEIVFSGTSVRIDSRGRVGFEDSSPRVRIRYHDLARSETSFIGSKSHEGKFVGQTGDGPLGVIGTWELGNVKGSYGADLVP